MHFQFKSKSRSIGVFDSFETTDFLVLTGRNGSGKSHFLQAIKDGAIAVGDIANEKIFLFNTSSFVVQNENAADQSALAKADLSLWEAWQKHNQPGGTLHALSIHLEPHTKTIVQISKESNTPIYELDPQKLEDGAVAECLSKFKNYLKFLLAERRPTDGVDRRLFFVAAKLEEPPNSITEVRFNAMFSDSQVREGILPASISSAFANYHQKFERNQYQQFRNEKFGESKDWLDDDGFVAAYGEKPWAIVNDILHNVVKLPYSITSPEGGSRDKPFAAQLIKNDSAGTSVPFSDLSSGERTLMALVASVYLQAGKNSKLPELLMFDEVDASLHPSMCKALVETIEKHFVSKGCKVILVTHSPTTVAVCPEKCVHLLNLSDTPIAKPSTQAEAVDELSEGFMTLSKGTMFFNQLDAGSINIITEGANTALIERALDLYEVAGVNVVKGLEAKSGKNQLKTFYDLFLVLKPTFKVLFVWDCDVDFVTSLVETPTLFRFAFTRMNNKYVSSGIENAFSESLLEPFVAETKKPNGNIFRCFDKGEKSNFMERILSRNMREDFVGFEGLIEKISLLKSSS